VANKTSKENNNNKLFGRSLNFCEIQSVFKSRGQHGAQRGGTPASLSVQAGAGEGEVWLIHHPNKQELTVLRQVQRS